MGKTADVLAVVKSDGKFYSATKEVKLTIGGSGGCNKHVWAKPFKAQIAEYRALEYFHTYMSNGLVVNGPGARK